MVCFCGNKSFFLHIFYTLSVFNDLTLNLWFYILIVVEFNEEMSTKQGIFTDVQMKTR